MTEANSSNYTKYAETSSLMLETMKKKTLFDDENDEREEIEASLKVNKEFANRFEVGAPLTVAARSSYLIFMRVLPINR